MTPFTPSEALSCSATTRQPSSRASPQGQKESPDTKVNARDQAVKMFATISFRAYSPMSASAAARRCAGNDQPLARARLLRTLASHGDRRRRHRLTTSSPLPPPRPPPLLPIAPMRTTSTNNGIFSSAPFSSDADQGSSGTVSKTGRPISQMTSL